MTAMDRLARASAPASGTYRVAALLARGRGSRVYVARHVRGGDDVALKLRSGGPDFRQEYAVGAQLRHPALLRMVEAGVQADGQAFLAMEYAERGHLGRHAGTCSDEDIATWVGEAATALAAMHAQGWVHRDVKPANLLLRRDGSLALADFGCACERGATPEPAGTMVGTPRYAAPEQSRGAPAEPAADVYSLGVVLFELLTGRPPFAGVTATELLGQHLLAPVPRLPEQQARWQGVVDAMLAKRASDRPAGGQDVAEMLKAK